MDKTAPEWYDTIEKRGGIDMTELGITCEIMLPMLILLLLGWFLRKVNWLSGETAGSMNKLVFKLFLPVMLFNNMRAMSSAGTPDPKYLIFLFVSVAGIFAAAFVLVPKLVHDPAKQGVMVQGIFRTNFAILGIPLMESMFGEAGILVYSLAVPVVIPLNNVLAVVALSAPMGKTAGIKKILKDILTNPLIIACAAGAVCLLLNIRFPVIVEDSLNKIAGITSPLSLLVLGASLKWQGIRDNRNELLWTVLLKQLIIPAVMFTVAVLLGFRGAQLGVMIILFGAPCAVSSYPMASSMGGDGPLAASQVVLTTVFSMGTLFALIYIGKLLALI